MKKAIVILMLSTISGMVSAQNINSNVKSNKAKLIELADKWNKRFEATNALIKQKSLLTNLVITKEVEGNLIQLKGFTETGMPLYYQTNNIIAAQSISTDKVYPGGSLGLGLTGSSMTIGEWDGGGVLETHQEYGGRATNMDNPGSTNYHATHVAGTMIAAGVDPFAKGMAYEATLSHYDWSNDESEMANEASNGLLVSNHSYGFRTGWSYNNFGDGLWAWYGDASISETDDYRHGYYDSNAQDWDEIALNAPYYLICKAAGNARNDGPSNAGAEHWYRNPSNGYTWELSTTTRIGDGPYDCINGSGVSKNILTVGAVDDVNGGYNGPNSVSMSSFSSWGPTDDGRIKPDVVANGVDVYSTYDNNNAAYNSISGTSMATPSVTGSLALVQEHYKNETNNYMKAATLKGLTIHTADESGTSPGPDYAFGWGLVNISKAVDVISEKGNTSIISENTLTSSQTETIEVYSDGTTPLMVTISWTDREGNVASAALDARTKVLVNDLNVKVSGNSQNYFPWKLNPNSPSSAATKGVNDVDNVEKVEVLSPVEGLYTITINHVGSLVGGSQNYSVIVTGIQAQPTFCTGNVIMNGNAGSFNDGSLADNYQANSNCTWYINPVGASSIELSFSAFDLHSTDAVNVYDGSSNAGTLLNSYTGSNIPDNLVSNNDEMYVEFVSDASLESAGFSASYTTTYPQSYCIPNGNTADGDYIDDFSVGTISNTNTGSATGADYTFYSNLSTDLSKGASYQVTTTSGTNTFEPNYVAVWIDYNRDGDFDDAGEKLGENALNNVPAETSNIGFTVPTNIALGATRLRVRLNWDQASMTACEAFFYGETEDYIVNIVEGSTSGDCIPDQSANGTSNGYYINTFRLMGMNNVGSGGVGNPEYSMYNNDTIVLSRNMMFNMQGELGDVDNASMDLWIDYNQNEIFETTELIGSYDFPLANTTYAIPFTTVPTDAAIGTIKMRIRTRPNGALADPCVNHSDQETEDYVVRIKEENMYCIPPVRSNGLDNDININAVTLGDIDNQNTGIDGGRSYNYFENLNTDLMVGSNQQLSVMVSQVYDPSQSVSAWIDYNNDGDFDDAGEKLGEFAASGNDATVLVDFIVPTNAQLGITRMRIRNTQEATNINACDDSAPYGETEDYNVNLLSDPCVNYPEKPAIISGFNEVCSSDVSTYYVTNNSAFESYEWTLPNGWTGSSNSNTIEVSDFDGQGNICVKGYSTACGFTNQTSCLNITTEYDFSNGELTFSGDTTLCSNASTILENYSVSHNFSNVDEYVWLPPVNASVTSGQGTNSVSMDLNNVDRNSSFEICIKIFNDCYEKEYCQLIQFDICSGVEEVSTQNSVSLSPNPSNGMFRVTSEKNNITSVTVYDVQGKKVMQTIADDNGSLALDLSGNQKGMYQVLITLKDARISKRILIQ
jgi:subtilisin family serine protease